MKPEDADTILPMLDEVIRSRFGTTLFPGGIPSNLAVIWKRELMKFDDAALATQAIAAIYSAPFEGKPKPPTPADVREMYRKLAQDARMKVPALPEPPGEGMPPWVKGWAVARFRHGDLRVWPQQKPGYDSLQRTSAATRTHVWPDQEPLPEPDQAKYEAEGANLTEGEVLALISTRTPDPEPDIDLVPLMGGPR